MDALRLNYNLSISPCALRFAERLSDNKWRIGNVESIDIDQAPNPALNNAKQKPNPNDYDIHAGNCFTILSEHGSLTCKVNSDPANSSVGINAAKQWMRTTPKDELDMSDEAKLALTIRTVEIEAFEVEMEMVYLEARKLDLTCRQYLALQSAQIGECKYFSLGGGKWSVILSEKTKLQTNAVAYDLDLSDMQTFVRLGYVTRNGRYIFNINSYPKPMSEDLLSRAFYLQQN